MLEPNAQDAERLVSFREALPATSAGIYLDTLGAGPLPAETARALAEVDEWDLRTGRAGVDRAADVEARMDEARAVLAALVGGDPDDIVLTHGLAHARAVAAGLAAAAGLAIRSLAHVGEATGATLTDAEVQAEAGSGPEAVLLDAGGSAGAMPISAPDLGVHFAAIPGQRWLLGPEGTGALWVDRRRMRTSGSALPPDADPLPRRAVLGLARSLGWLEMYVGLPWIHERTARLAGATREALAAIDGVVPLTPAGSPSGIVVFRIAGWSADAAAAELGARVFAILGPPPAADVLRISIGAFNSEDELNRFLDTVSLLAAHTPETLPRRESLIVLSAGRPG
jgi:L-cysteine/cystine lyase